MAIPLQIAEYKTHGTDRDVLQSGKRIPQLDGIRGTAILLVVFSHYVVGTIDPERGIVAGAIFRAGALAWSGVDLFFVLSGFLIGGILMDAKGSPNYFKTFYIRRAFRILPIYLAVLGTYLLFWVSFGRHSRTVAEVFGGPEPWYVYLTFTQNLWIAHHGWANTFLSVGWSLSVEEQFYLLLPTVIFVVPKRALPFVVVGLAFASSAFRFVMYLHYGSFWARQAYVLLFSRADALMLGVTCAIVMRSVKWKAVVATNRGLAGTCLATLGSACIVFSYRGWVVGTRPMSLVGYTWMALLYSCVLMTAIVWPRGLLGRIFCMRWLGRLGAIAYGVYLLHVAVLDAAFHLLLHRAPKLTNWADALTIFSAVFLTLAMAQLSWNYFESKLVKIGHTFVYSP